VCGAPVAFADQPRALPCVRFGDAHVGRRSPGPGVHAGLRKEEFETQMKQVDKKRCTQIVAEPALGHTLIPNSRNEKSACGPDRLADEAAHVARRQISRAPSACNCVHPPSSALRFFSEYSLPPPMVTIETEISDAARSMAANQRCGLAMTGTRQVAIPRKMSERRDQLPDAL
jgi:hypothetical protein